MPGPATGYRQESETKIDPATVTLFGNDDYTIVTKILSGKKLNPARAVLGVSNPFVDVIVSPPDPRFGDQLQRSSYKPLTLAPVWAPHERFQHTTNIANSRILFSVYHLRSTNLRSPPSLGDCVINVTDVTEEPVTRTLRLYEQTTGKELDGELTVMVQKIPSKKALRHMEHIVYEYERWQPIIGWGNKNMLPTDPGSYANEFGTKFARTFNEVAPPIPRGWLILTEFHCLGNNWEYSVDLTRSDWYSEKGNNCFVRRRPWFREIIDPDYHRISKLLSEPPPPPLPVAPPVVAPLPATNTPTPAPPPSTATASAAPLAAPSVSSNNEKKSSSQNKENSSLSSTKEQQQPSQPPSTSSTTSEKTKKQKKSNSKPDWIDNRPSPTPTPTPTPESSTSPMHGNQSPTKLEVSSTKNETAVASKGCCVVM